MNSYGSNSSYTVSQPQRHDYQQQFSGSSLSFAPPIPDQQEHLSQQKQSDFHTRVRDMYFSSWNKKQPESPWQGHKNPNVYEGDEIHCFNSYCTMTFRFPGHLVDHEFDSRRSFEPVVMELGLGLDFSIEILNSECGEITPQEVSCLVRDWKALQIQLSRCGKLRIDEIGCLERTWEYLQGEQQQSRMITRELIGFLVVAWEILSGNRSMYALPQPPATASLMQEGRSSSLKQENDTVEEDQGWKARFRYSTGNAER